MPPRFVPHIIVAVMMLTVAGCDLLSGSDKCGPRRTKILEIHTKHNGPGDSSDRTYLRADQMRTQDEGNFRRFIAELDVSNVCTDEHATLKFTASGVAADELEFNLTARADWGLLHGAEYGLTRRTSNLGGKDWWFWESAESEIGLKQVYGDDAGQYFIRMDMTFLKTGDLQMDKNWLEDQMGFSGVIETTYYEHK